MNVIQIDENGVAYGYPVLADNFRMLFPTVSFPNPLTTEAVESFGFGCYDFASQPECEPTQKVVEVAPRKGEDGIYRQTYEIVELTESELAARTQAQWAFIRGDRNRRLSTCDWTQLPDASADAATWAIYRQELRDITTQSDPFNIVWPVVPSRV
jgi:hypothetical protein